MIKKFELFEGRKTKEEQYYFNRRVDHLINFFNSDDMVRWEPDPDERLKKWLKIDGSINIDKVEAKALKKKLGFGGRKFTQNDPLGEENWED